MDRERLRTTLLDLLEQETWERPETFTDDIKIREGLKLDSVDLLGVMLRAEATLGVSLDSRDFDKIATVGDLLDTIVRKDAARSKNKAA
jgi:acyl carrier protein